MRSLDENKSCMDQISDDSFWSSRIDEHYSSTDKNEEMTEIKILLSRSNMAAFITIERDFYNLNKEKAIQRWTDNYKKEIKNQKQKHCKTEFIKMIKADDFKVIYGGYCYQTDHSKVRNTMAKLARELGWDALNHAGRNSWKRKIILI